VKHFGGCGPLRSLPGTCISKSVAKNLAGVPDALIFFCSFSFINKRRAVDYPLKKNKRKRTEEESVENLAGVPDALIFFCSFSFLDERKGGCSPRKN